MNGFMSPDDFNSLSELKRMFHVNNEWRVRGKPVGDRVTYKY